MRRSGNFRKNGILDAGNSFEVEDRIRNRHSETAGIFLEVNF